jgi:Flp pilus assembly protein TadD
MDLGVPSALRVENVIGAAGQRDQQQLATFHFEAGRRAFEAGRDAEAISELRRAVYLAPYDHQALLLLGRAYLRSGRVADAVNAFTISIWSTDTTEARVALAQAHASTGDLDEARAELRIVLDREPAHAEASRLLDDLAGR